MPLDRGDQFLRRLRQQLERFHRLAAQMQQPRLDLGRAGLRLRDAQHARDEERPAAEEFQHLEALLALADEMVRAVGRGDVAHDVGDRAHAMHVDRRRIGDLGVALHQDADLALLAHGLLRGRDRARPADRDRQDHAGKQHDVAHRHDDQRVRRQRRQTALRPRPLRARPPPAGLACSNERIISFFSHGHPALSPG